MQRLFVSEILRRNGRGQGQLPHQESRHDPNRTVVASHVNLPQVEVVGEAPSLDFWAVEGATNSWVFGALPPPRCLSTPHGGGAGRGGAGQGRVA
jgi:hypothetical protein